MKQPKFTHAPRGQGTRVSKIGVNDKIFAIMRAIESHPVGAPEAVGRAMGVGDITHAIEQGSMRLSGLIRAGLVERSLKNFDLPQGSVVKYHLTAKGIARMAELANNP